MAIVGRHPESGVRIDVERDGSGPPWRYSGEATTAGTSYPVSATVDAQGGVVVQAAEGAPAGVADTARLILRAAWKHAAADGAPPPRHLARWRGDD